jgi:plastocyanin
LTRIKLALAAAVIAALAALPAAQAATILVGTSGPGFTITLTSAGKKVIKLKAGTFVIRVQDKSDIHNFHLVGPGYNKKTSVAGTGTTTWTVKLRPGKYTYVCDPHAASMKGSFTVVA